MPVPTPVPNVTTKRCLTPLAHPHNSSLTAAKFASLSTNVGSLKSSSNLFFKSTLPHDKLGGSCTMPVKKLAFGAPTPMPIGTLPVIVKSLSTISFNLGR